MGRNLIIFSIRASYEELQPFIVSLKVLPRQKFNVFLVNNSPRIDPVEDLLIHKVKYDRPVLEITKEHPEKIENV